jgi:hypothetical protein
MPKVYPHGTRARYTFNKCRCSECRAANSAYQRRWAKKHTKTAARLGYEASRFTDAAPVRKHLCMLSREGVGRHQVAKVSGVRESTLSALIYGKSRGNSARRSPPSRRILKRDAEKILAVTPSDRADHALVDAEPVWKQIREMEAFGVSRKKIGRAIGPRAPRPYLQLKKGKVIARSARRIAALHWNLWRRNWRFRESCTCSVPGSVLARTVTGEGVEM